jgi:hypothetical protein
MCPEPVLFHWRNLRINHPDPVRPILLRHLYKECS